jgi:hypothetical protein
MTTRWKSYACCVHVALYTAESVVPEAGHPRLGLAEWMNMMKRGIRARIASHPIVPVSIEMKIAPIVFHLYVTTVRPVGFV